MVLEHRKTMTVVWEVRIRVWASVEDHTLVWVEGHTQASEDRKRVWVVVHILVLVEDRIQALEVHTQVSVPSTIQKNVIQRN